MNFDLNVHRFCLFAQISVFTFYWMSVEEKYPCSLCRSIYRVKKKSFFSALDLFTVQSLFNPRVRSILVSKAGQRKRSLFLLCSALNTRRQEEQKQLYGETFQNEIINVAYKINQWYFHNIFWTAVQFLGWTLLVWLCQIFCTQNNNVFFSVIIWILIWVFNKNILQHFMEPAGQLIRIWLDGSQYYERNLVLKQLNNS